MAIGTCGLCRANSVSLQDSHLMPKALYRVLLKASAAHGDPNPNPVVWTPGIAMHTSAQVSDYLLCASCEDRFSQRGEKWVTGQCWRSDSEFRLRETLDT